MVSSPKNAKRTDKKKTVQELIAEGKPFNSRRELAFQRPDRARDKLNGYAKVSVKILKGRNLPMADIEGSSDPFVEVLLNDVVKQTTKTVWKSLNPVWSDDAFEIQIKNPADVIMLRVMDYDFDIGLGTENDVLGFAEIPVADLEPDHKIEGWCILCPKESLEGTATERLTKKEEAHEEEYGAILVELELSIVSNEKSDEMYAWCLPTPEFMDYPEGGVITRKDLDMQKLMDTVDELKTALLVRLIAPFKGFIFFVLGWKDIKLSVVFFTCTLGMGLRPDYFLCLLFGLWGTVFAMLRDPSLRQAITANPSTVPLNDAGFELVAKMQNTDSTLTFLQRVVVALRGKVVDNDDLRTYAAFATEEGKPKQTYEELCYELKNWGEKNGKKGKMVSFENKPLDKGTLVKCEEGVGQITKVIGEVPVGAMVSNDIYVKNPILKVTEYKYEVTLTHHSSDKEKASEEIVETLEKKSSEIMLRTDLRWLATPTVLALIPNSVEDTIMGYLPTLKNVKNSLKSTVKSLDDLFGWQNPESPGAKSTSEKACMGLFALSILTNPLVPIIPLIFICSFFRLFVSWQFFIISSWFVEIYIFSRLLLVAVTVLLFAATTDKWKAHFNEKKGKKQYADCKKTNEKNWGFWKASDSVAPTSTSKDLTGAPFSSARGTVCGLFSIFNKKEEAKKDA